MMKIERDFISGFEKPDNVKILHVTGKLLAEHIREYLLSHWDIYTFCVMDITNKMNQGIQVYEMQFTPLISSEKLEKAILELDNSTVSYYATKISDEPEPEMSNEPTDWEDYWNYHKKIRGSFAHKNFQNAHIEKLTRYQDIVGISDEFRTKFPNLTKLLDEARVTKITSSSNESYYLLGWSFKYGYFGGLTREPIKNDLPEYHRDHNLLLKNFAGFIDYFGDSIDTNFFSSTLWQFSHEEIVDARSRDYYLNNSFYLDQCKEKGVKPALNLLNDFVQFTEDFRGDFFAYDRNSGEVWIFKHEGFGDGIIHEEYGDDVNLIKVSGASEGLFFKLENCSIIEWVEKGAGAWLKCFEELPFDINEL